MLLSCGHEVFGFGWCLSFENEVSPILSTICEHNHDSLHLDSMKVG